MAKSNPILVSVAFPDFETSRIWYRTLKISQNRLSFKPQCTPGISPICYIVFLLCAPVCYVCHISRGLDYRKLLWQHPIYIWWNSEIIVNFNLSDATKGTTAPPPIPAQLIAPVRLVLPGTWPSSSWTPPPSWSNGIPRPTRATEQIPATKWTVWKDADHRSSSSRPHQLCRHR